MRVEVSSDRFLIFAVLAASSLFSLGQIIFDNLVYAQLMHELEQHIGTLEAEILSKSSSIALLSHRRSRCANPHLLPNAMGRYLTHTSTRRFLSRPASLSLQATGSAGPYPRASTSLAYCGSRSF